MDKKLYDRPESEADTGWDRRREHGVETGIP